MQVGKGTRVSSHQIITHDDLLEVAVAVQTEDTTKVKWWLLFSLARQTSVRETAQISFTDPIAARRTRVERPPIRRAPTQKSVDAAIDYAKHTDVNLERVRYHVPEVCTVWDLMKIDGVNILA